MKLKHFFTLLLVASLFFACNKEEALVTPKAAEAAVQTDAVVQAAAEAGDVITAAAGRNKVFLKRRPSDCWPTNVQTYCVVVQPATNAIVSVQDFMNRVNAGIYPLNMLSEQAVAHFAHHLLFEGDIWTGGDYTMVRNELPDGPFQEFFVELLGGE